MFNLKKLFSSSKVKEEKKPENIVFPPELVIQSGGANITVDKIDELFYGWLLGVNSVIDAELNPFETEAIRQLKDLLQQDLKASNILPRVPSVLPRVIQSIRDENSNARKIAELIEKDPVLVGDVMRLVNSPYYRTRNKITTLQQATVMLGRDGLRRLVSSAIIKPLLNLKAGHFSQLATRRLWEQSEKTAFAASLLCREDEETQFHAYLSGILHNIGFTVGFKILDKVFDKSYAPNSKQFQAEFVSLCKQLTLKAVQGWSMPKQVNDALDPEYKISNEASFAFAEYLYVADKLSKAQLMGDRLKLDVDNAVIKLSQQDCGQCRYALESINHQET